MPDSQPASTPIPSLVAVRGHPIHPMLIPFPIAFLIGALAADFAYWGTSDPFWAEAALWLTLAGLVMGVLAAAVGLVEFVGRRRIRQLSEAWGHLAGNALVLILALVSLGLRWNAPEDAVLPWGLVLSATIAAILVVTGWLGGEMAYRHRVGAIAPDEAAAMAVSVEEEVLPPTPANVPGAEPGQRRRGGG